MAVTNLQACGNNSTSTHHTCSDADNTWQLRDDTQIPHLLRLQESERAEDTDHRWNEDKTKTMAGTNTPEAVNYYIAEAIRIVESSSRHHLSALISFVRGRTGLLEKIGEGFQIDIRFFLKIRLANQKFLYGII